jgi:hypothetical protein
MAACFLALLSSFSSDSARSTVSPYHWSISDFCQDLSTTSCTRQQPLFEYSVLVESDYSKVQSRTFIHCSARRIDSKLRATIAGLMRSSARSSSPPRLVAAASDTGADTTRNQPFANTYIWLQYGCFGCIWNQLHRSEVVDKWLKLERCNSLRQP